MFATSSCNSVSVTIPFSLQSNIIIFKGEWVEEGFRQGFVLSKRKIENKEEEFKRIRGLNYIGCRKERK